MNKQSSIEGVILEELTELTLAEVCRACATHAENIMDLVDEGIITPRGDGPQRWVFTGVHLRRARVGLRLQSDLGVNRAGAALAVQLLEEIDALRAKLRAFERG